MSRIQAGSPEAKKRSEIAHARQRDPKADLTGLQREFRALRFQAAVREALAGFPQLTAADLAPVVGMLTEYCDEQRVSA